MTIGTSGQALSYEDYAAIDDDRRYQVLEGELVAMPSVDRRHQRLVVRLTQALANYADASGEGEAFVAPFDPGDVLTSPLLPGFELAIGPVFEGLD